VAQTWGPPSSFAAIAGLNSTPQAQSWDLSPARLLRPGYLSVSLWESQPPKTLVKAPQTNTRMLWKSQIAPRPSRQNNPKKKVILRSLRME
jgi:hypothetical protein